MNLIPRLTPYLSEDSVRRHYNTVAFGTFGTIWRRRRLILAATAIGLALGGLALLVLKKSYTADALIQLDFGREDASRAGPSTTVAGPALDAAALVESEARVLRSRVIARRVVDRLGLRTDPVFANLAPMTSWFGPSQDGIKSESGRDGEAIRGDLIALALIRNLTVTNDTRAYLINVAYSSDDAARSATLVNAFTDEYLRNRMEVNLNAAQRTSSWLSAQIQETRTALDEADAAVNTYRRHAEAPFVAAEGGTGQEQPIQEFARRLDVASRARTLEENRLVRTRALLTSDTPPSAQDFVGSPLLKSLFEQRASLKQDDDGTGPDRPSTADAASVRAELETRLRTEIERLIGEGEREVRTATLVEAAIGKRLQELRDAAVDAKKREGRLKNLQLDAASLRDRLKLLTENYSQAVAAAGLRSANAQVVMRAEPIPLPSGPNALLILGLAVFGSAGIGTAASLLLEKRKTGFKSEADLTAETQASCLAMIPAPAANPMPGEERILGHAIELACAALDIQAISGATRVLLVTSSVPNEGKSDFCRAVAGAMAKKRLRTLVIDVLPPVSGGIRSPGPSLDDVLLADSTAFFDNGLDATTITLRASGRMTTAEMQAGGRLSKLIQAAKIRFHLVILEAPPVLLMIDFLPLAGFADTHVHLVQWNATPRQTVVAALKRMESLSVSARGIVLTRVDLREHDQFVAADQCNHYTKYQSFYDRSRLVRT